MQPELHIGSLTIQTFGICLVLGFVALPWAMAYPHGTVPTTVRVQPTPVYELLAMGLIAALLWRLRDRYRPGMLFAIYLVLTGTERLLVEFIRRNPRVFAGLTIAQLISIPVIAVGLNLARNLSSMSRTRADWERTK